MEIDARERRLIRDECRRQQLPIVSVCCVAVGLIDFNPSVQRFHVERAKAYIDLVYELEAKNLLLVLGEYIWNREVIPPAEQWRTARRQLSAAGKTTLDHWGWRSRWSWSRFRCRCSITSTDGRLPRRGDHPALKANIDVSHLHLAHVEPAEVRKLRAKPIHVHISDCDGKVHGDLPPGRGVVDFSPYLRGIKALGIDGAISIELEYSPEPDKIEEWVREAYDATDRLLGEAALRG